MGTEPLPYLLLEVNIFELCIHLSIKPLNTRILNALQTCVLALIAYINFGGFVAKALLVSKALALERGDGSTAAEVDYKVLVVQIIMEILTMLLLVTFACYGGFKIFLRVAKSKRLSKRLPESVKASLRRIKTETSHSSMDVSSFEMRENPIHIHARSEQASVQAAPQV